MELDNNHNLVTHSSVGSGKSWNNIEGTTPWKMRMNKRSMTPVRKTFLKIFNKAHSKRKQSVEISSPKLRHNNKKAEFQKSTPSPTPVEASKRKPPMLKTPFMSESALTPNRPRPGGRGKVNIVNIRIGRLIYKKYIPRLQRIMEVEVEEYPS